MTASDLMTMSGDEDPSNVLSEIYHTVSAPRRCHVIQLLAKSEEDRLPVRTLAREIAAIEEEVAPDRATGEPYRNVYNGLSQTCSHLRPHNHPVTSPSLPCCPYPQCFPTLPVRYSPGPMHVAVAGPGPHSRALPSPSPLIPNRRVWTPAGPYRATRPDCRLVSKECGSESMVLY